MLVEIFSIESAVLYFDPKKRILHLNWGDFVSAKAYFDVLRLLIENIQKLKAVSLVIDCSLSDFDNMAIVADMFAKYPNELKYSDLTYIARVLAVNYSDSTNLYKRMKKHQEAAGLKIIVSFFTDKLAALDWLYRSTGLDNVGYRY